MRRLWLSLMATFALMLFPAVAMAEEVSFLDSFAGGLSDFVSPEVVQNENSVYSVREVGNEGETPAYDVTDISGVVDAWTTIPAFGNTMKPLQFARILLTRMIDGTWAAVVALVFMLWGLRKSVKMVFASFRKGKMSA